MEEIKNFIGEFNRAPFLFVGSGLSRRYLSLEDWKGLLIKFCDLIGKDYQYYFASAEQSLPKVATLLANDLHEQWWHDPKYERSRKRYKDICNDKEAALKIEIAHYIKGAISNITTDEELLNEIKLLKKVVVDGVITTNWDNLLEQIFNGFKTYVGQNELIFSSSQGVGEIYKIHGCSSQPNSLVLTERDYQGFEKRNPYLAAKLLTIFTEHPIVFLGYSLGDENILTILDSISSCLTSDNIRKLQDRLIFIQWDPNVQEPTFSTHTISVDSIRIPVKTITLSSFTPLYKALGAIDRKFPARLLRQLKEHVYDLVISNDKVSKLYVQNIDAAEHSIKDLEVVFGVGAINKVAGAGYKRIGRQELIDDLIHDNKNFDSNKILEDTLPELLKNTTYTPFFKPLVTSKYYSNYNLQDVTDQRIIEHFNKAIRKDHYYPKEKSLIKRKEEIEKLKFGITDFIKNHDLRYFLKVFPYIDENLFTSEDLLGIITENAGILTSNNEGEKSCFYKLLCFYDWYRYYRNK